MDSQNTISYPQNQSSSIFNNNNFIITVLVILLIFSFLGINLLVIFGNLLQSIVQYFSPVASRTLSDLGYATGTIINKTTDITEDAVKTSVDITGGAIQSVGNLLIKASDENRNKSLDSSINSSKGTLRIPEPSPSENPIQKPISASKSQWCLVGEYKESRGCIEVGEHDKCISGQIFPSQQLCLNPTLSQNRRP